MFQPEDDCGRKKEKGLLYVRRIKARHKNLECHSNNNGKHGSDHSLGAHGAAGGGSRSCDGSGGGHGNGGSGGCGNGGSRGRDRGEDGRESGQGAEHWNHRGWAQDGQRRGNRDGNGGRGWRSGGGVGAGERDKDGLVARAVIRGDLDNSTGLHKGTTSKLRVDIAEFSNSGPESLSNRLEVVTSLHTVATALDDGVGGGLSGGTSTARSRERRNLDGLAVLEDGTCAEARVDSEEVIKGNTESASNSGNEITRLDNVDAARVTGLVGVTASLRPGGKLEVLVGLEDAVGNNVSIEVLELLVVDAEGLSNRVDGVTLLDDVDLAVLVAVVCLHVGATGLLGAGQADLLADLEEGGRLAACTDGSIELICIELWQETK